MKTLETLQLVDPAEDGDVQRAKVRLPGGFGHQGFFAQSMKFTPIPPHPHITHRTLPSAIPHRDPSPLSAHLSQVAARHVSRPHGVVRRAAHVYAIRGGVECSRTHCRTGGQARREHPPGSQHGGMRGEPAYAHVSDGSFSAALSCLRPLPRSMSTL